MLAILGPFVFATMTAPYQQFQRKTEWSWATNSRQGRRDAAQYTGPGDDVITLSGVLMPEVTGGRITLDALRALASGGQAWPLIDGEGMIYGLWFITAVSETRSEMMQNGEARRIEFNLSLKRYDDTNIDTIGALTRVALGLL